MMLLSSLTWVHLLCMIGAFGALLAIQTAVPKAMRNGPEVSRGVSKIVNILLGLGFLAGIASYGVRHGHALGAHFNGIIGLKFVLLLVVGALLGMSGKAGKGDLFRTISLVLLAVAALAGSTLFPH